MSEIDIEGKHYRVKELAQMWSVSRWYIRDLFQDEPGVVILNRPITGHKRAYSTMLIPEAVAARVYQRSMQTSTAPIPEVRTKDGPPETPPERAGGGAINPPMRSRKERR